MRRSKKASEINDVLGMALWTLIAFLILVITLVFGLQDKSKEADITQITLSNDTKTSKESRSFLDDVEGGIHVPTGLIYDSGFEEIYTSCLACHSAKLITQNRATRNGWEEMIRWMQATQGLGDLTSREDAILDYLAEHYAPEEVARRVNLDLAKIEWYVLED